MATLLTLSNSDGVAIPPYRSGQFRVGGMDGVKRFLSGELVSRNPSVPIRAVPSYHFSGLIRLEEMEKVAIPPYRSGQFRGLIRLEEMQELGRTAGRNPSVPIRAVPSG